MRAKILACSPVAAAAALASGAHAQEADSAAASASEAGASALIQTYNEAQPDKLELRTPAMVYAPGLTAGMNPCAGSATGGVSTVVGGITGGRSFRDRNCEMRNLAGLLYQMGEGDAAKEVLCGDGRVREAFAAIGEPCIADMEEVPISYEERAINTSLFSRPERRRMRGPRRRV